MTDMEAAKQAIWLKELMVEIMNKEDKKLSSWPLFYIRVKLSSRLLQS